MTAHPRTSPSALAQLRVKWAGFLSLTAVTVASGYFALENLWGPVEAARWTLMAFLGMALLSASLWRGLELNYSPGNGLTARLGPANHITLLRGLALASLAGFLLLPEPPGALAWLPAGLYALAASLDYLDGYVARITGQVTRLGEHLDLSLDGVGVALAATLAVLYGRLPIWYLPVGLARYAYLVGIAWRRRKQLPVYELPENTSRRALAGAQMGLIAVVLFPVFTPPGTTIVATLFMLPFLIGFLRDWQFAATGRDPLAGWLASLPGRSLGPGLSLGLRVTTVVLLALSALAGWPATGSLGTLLAPLGPLSGSRPPLGLAVQALLGIALAVGWAPRSAALGVLMLMGFYQRAGGLVLGELLLLACATAVFFLGSGPWALWTPEETIIQRRFGER